MLATALRANIELQEFEVVDTDGLDCKWKHDLEALRKEDPRFLDDSVRKSRLSGLESRERLAKKGLPGACVNLILQAAPHLLSARIAGVQRSSSHWQSLAAALLPMRLESVGITYKTSDYEAEELEEEKNLKEEEKNLGSKQSVAAAAAVAKVLAGMRTLRAALRPPWADSGLRSSRTISDVDLSFNTFDPSAVKALPAWVLKSIVKELVLEGIVLASSDTHSDRVSRDNHRTGISGLYDLVKSLGAPQSRLQVFVMTLAHPPQCKQGAGARAAVAGAVSNKKLKRLTTTCSTAGSSTRTGHFFCVGLYDLYDADASGSGLNANRRGTRCAAICSRDVLAAAFPGGVQHSPRFA